jgi:hypothetical protein
MNENSEVAQGGFPFWLPWCLASLLGVICIFLMTQINALQQENGRLRQQLSARQP